MVPAIERVELRTPGGIIDVDLAVASRHATHRNGDAPGRTSCGKITPVAIGPTVGANC